MALSNAVNLFLEKIRTDSTVVPSFNTFYEFIRDEYQEILKTKRTREKDFDVWGFLNVLEPYYKGGEYDYLLNSEKQLDLLSKRFIVFELDNIKDNKVLFPIVTIIIMETFINKMRKLKGIRKMILLEEAWKAISKEGMAEYLKYLSRPSESFRRGRCRYPGGGRHHFVTHRQGNHHQQQRLQDFVGPEEVCQQVR